MRPADLAPRLEPWEVNSLRFRLSIKERANAPEWDAIHLYRPDCGDRVFCRGLARRHGIAVESDEDLGQLWSAVARVVYPHH